MRSPNDEGSQLSNFHFPWNNEEKLVSNSFFSEYNLYFKNPLNPFRVVYHPVSCFLHPYTHTHTHTHTHTRTHKQTSLLYYQCIKPVCPVNICQPLHPLNRNKHICFINFSESIRCVSSCKPVRPVDFSKPMCTLDGLRSVCPVIFSKSVRPVDALKLVRSVNSSKIICSVTSSNFVLFVDIHTIDTNKPLRPVNSGSECPVDVRKPIPSVSSNKIVRTVNYNKPANYKNVRPVDTRKPVCPVNSSTLVRFLYSSSFVLPVDICTVDSYKPLRLVSCVLCVLSMFVNLYPL